jgi:hypothetical protein
MIVANIVIRTLPGKGPAVERHLGAVPGLGPLHLDGGHRLYGTWRVTENETPERLAERLSSLDPDIVAVYPAQVREA